MELLKSLLWRYTTKQMNGHTVSEEKLNAIMEAIRLSPSSLGLQPYTILVISSIKMKSELKAMSGSPLLISQSSHLLVFAAWTDVSLKHIHEHITNMADTWKVPEAAFNGIKEMLLSVAQQPKEDNFNWNARQAYIALGVALVAAADQKVDATPLEEFNHEALDNYLGLKPKGLRSVALLALGFRDEADEALARQPKVRRQKEKLFVVPQLKKRFFDKTLLL